MSIITFLNRLRTIRKDLVGLLIASILDIILVEFWLIDIPASNAFIFHLGQVVLRLCYSYVSAFTFYLLVVHLPKEKRKKNSSMAIRMKLLYITLQIDFLISQVYKDANKDEREATFEVEIKECCKLVSAYSAVNSVMDSHLPIQDWYDFLEFKRKKIKQSINELYLLNESIDSDLFPEIANIDKYVSLYMSFENDKFGNITLEFLSDALIELRNQKNELNRKYEAKYNLYDKEIFDKD